MNAVAVYFFIMWHIWTFAKIIHTMREVDIHNIHTQKRRESRKSCKHVVNLCRKFHVQNHKIKISSQTKQTTFILLHENKWIRADTERDETKSETIGFPISTYNVKNFLIILKSYRCVIGRPHTECFDDVLFFFFLLDVSRIIFATTFHLIWAACYTFSISFTLALPIEEQNKHTHKWNTKIFAKILEMAITVCLMLARLQVFPFSE